MKWPLRLAAPLLAYLMLAVLPGCGVVGGSSGVKISGKLVKNGQPLRVSKDTQVKVIFSPEDKTTGTTFPPAKFTYDTATYEILLPPGMYRVRWTILDKDQQAVSSSPETAKIVHDLTSSKELDIDVGSGQ